MEFNLIKDWYQLDKWTKSRVYARVYEINNVEFEEIQTRYDDDSCDLYIMCSIMHGERGLVLDSTCGIRCIGNEKGAITNFSIKLLADNVIKLEDYQEFLDAQIEAYKCATALYDRYVTNINKTGYYITDNSRGAYRYYDPKNNYEWNNPLNHAVTRED